MTNFSNKGSLSSSLAVRYLLLDVVHYQQHYLQFWLVHRDGNEGTLLRPQSEYHLGRGSHFHRENCVRQYLSKPKWIPRDCRTSLDIIKTPIYDICRKVKKMCLASIYLWFESSNTLVYKSRRIITKRYYHFNDTISSKRLILSLNFCIGNSKSEILFGILK